MEYTTILDFWFDELDQEGRFNGGKETDRKIAERFSDLHSAAVAGELGEWRATPEGSLAEIIVLDQFSRNLYRGQPEAFASDGQSLVLAEVAIERGFDQKLPVGQRMFIYMPFMHSESRQIHETAVELFTDLGIEESLKYEKVHKDIIDRFGRYPHRNEQLGRESTPEEIEYLSNESESFFNS